MEPVLPIYQDQTNFLDEPRCKNSQLNTYKLNLITQRNQRTWSSWFHLRDVMIFQHMQINEHNTAHKQNKGQKSGGHLNRPRNRSDVPQYNKDYI
jgi:hypothetical protein